MGAVPLVVPTVAGLVRGRREAGLTAWRGVPYAAPPVGALRFRAPVAPAPWPGVLDATTDGPLPPQQTTAPLFGAGPRTATSEDCLTLTVLRRTSGSTAKPVMVFLHGGAYAIGGGTAGAYRGDSLAAAGDVVFVGFNYRLGALGWLDCTAYGTPERPVDGNLGLRDQVAALQWVRANIAAFGGDPANVTVFGESAGGTSVLTLLTTPPAAGTFARAIAESAAIGAVHRRDRSRRWTADLVDALPGDGAAALLEASPRELVAALGRVEARVADELPGARVLGPVVDGDLVPDYPLEVLRRGRAVAVPLLIGTNADEGTLFQHIRSIRANRTRLERLFAETVPTAEETVLALYPGRRTPRRLARFVTDLMFWTSSVDAAVGHSTAAPVWMYRFDLAPPAMRVLGLGATHGAELDHVFARRDSPTLRLATVLGGRRTVRAVTRRMSAAWLTFARTGRPPASWPAFDGRYRRTMVFDRTERVVEDPDAPVRSAWSEWRPYD